MDGNYFSRTFFGMTGVCIALCLLCRGLGMRHFRSEASREPHTKISYFFGGGMFCDGNYGVLVVLFGFSSHTKLVANHSINQ